MKAFPSHSRFFLVLALTLPFVMASRSGAQAPATRYFALVVGDDDYVSLPRLRTAAADAHEVESVLRKYYGFRTKLLLNATRSQIVAALDSYRRELGPDANLLIYYAGHGYSDKETEKTYWLPVDAAKYDTSNWIIADEITSDIRAIPARHVLVISDSCYSGTLTRGLSVSLPSAPGSVREQFLRKMMAGRSRTLMASGGEEPVADGGGGGHSVFAAALLRGLQQMEKAQFTAGELFSGYVVESVAGRAEQTPVYDPLRNSGHESGDFVFVRIRMPDGKAVEVTANNPMPATVDPEAIELSYWDSIRGSTDPADFKAYLEKYPTGQFAALAKNKINSLRPATNPTGTPSPSPGGATRPASAQSLLSPEDPAPLQKGINKGTADSLVGTHYWYYYALPGSSRVTVRFKPATLYGAQMNNNTLTVTLYDEKRTWHTTKVIAAGRGPSDATFTAEKLDKKVKIIVSVAPPNQNLIRMGGDYEIEATGDVQFDEPKATGDPIIRTFFSMVNNYGATKFLADGTLETSDGLTGSWKAFDPENHIYTVTIGDFQISVQYRPGYGLVDAKNPTLVVFQEIRK